ncbi:hypothetical protein O5269_27890, partial [Escherichia coli]|nr:hypothetical protein [Escherichia coli]
PMTFHFSQLLESSLGQIVGCVLALVSEPGKPRPHAGSLKNTEEIQRAVILKMEMMPFLDSSHTTSVPALPDVFSDSDSVAQ